jgi:hypothetical protein
MPALLTEGADTMETTKKVIAANAGFDLILPNAVRRGGFEAHPIVG